MDHNQRTKLIGSAVFSHKKWRFSQNIWAMEQFNLGKFDHDRSLFSRTLKTHGLCEKGTSSPFMAFIYSGERDILFHLPRYMCISIYPLVI